MKENLHPSISFLSLFGKTRSKTRTTPTKIKKKRKPPKPPLIFKKKDEGCVLVVERKFKKKKGGGEGRSVASKGLSVEEGQYDVIKCEGLFCSLDEKVTPLHPYDNCTRAYVAPELILERKFCFLMYFI